MLMPSIISLATHAETGTFTGDLYFSFMGCLKPNCPYKNPNIQRKANSQHFPSTAQKTA
jgi:hypothetical protein